jgi:hypothetical protein
MVVQRQARLPVMRRKRKTTMHCSDDGDEDGVEHAACGGDAQSLGDVAAYDCAYDAEQRVNDEAVA